MIGYIYTLKEGCKKMRQLTFSILIAVVLSLLALPAMAVVVNFDDLGTPNAYPQANDFGPFYAGFSWNGWEVMNQSTYQAIYHDATPLPSNPNFAYLGYDPGETWTISSVDPFNFLGAQFAYWPSIGTLAANSVTVRGYLGANLVGTVSTGQLSLVWAGSGGISGVDKLVFSTSPGSKYFRMDNFSYDAVPEPLSLFLGGSGLVGFGLLKRWRKTAAATTSG